MSSSAQIAANQANAQHSTGPATDAGKEACKFNATKHALSGKQIVVPGEDPAEYDALLAKLLVELAPANEREAMLSVEVVEHSWRHQRAIRIESQVLAKYGAVECITEPEARKAFSLITRYGTSIERSLRRSREALDKLQKERKEVEVKKALAALMKSKAAAAPAPQPTAPNSKIGSVSQGASNRHPNEDLPLSCRL
jgi:hypothetical protein